MKTKTDIIKEAIYKEDWKKVFNIASKFFTGLTKDQKRSIDIAHECNTGKKDFYKSIGIDIDNEINQAKSILIQKFA